MKRLVLREITVVLSYKPGKYIISWSMIATGLHIGI